MELFFYEAIAFLRLNLSFGILIQPLLYYICDYDKRTSSGFKGQGNVAEEVSLTLKTG